jgi:hypothetical protein
MISPNHFTALGVSGHADVRAVVLSVEDYRVRNFLPAGLELGDQDITGDGCHPVILLFSELRSVQMSFPLPGASTTCRQHSFVVPFSYLSSSSITPGFPGPYQYMPRLYTDSPLTAFASRLFWGFAQQLGAFEVTTDRFTVKALDGQPLASLAWDMAGRNAPPPEGPGFGAVRAMLDQPLISMVPASMGPFFVLSNLERNWNMASSQPMAPILEVDMDYVNGYPTTASDAPPVLSSYALNVPWRLSAPFHPIFGSGR